MKFPIENDEILVQPTGFEPVTNRQEVMEEFVGIVGALSVSTSFP